jgi:hypothetical protein
MYGVCGPTPHKVSSPAHQLAYTENKLRAAAILFYLTD